MPGQESKNLQEVETLTKSIEIVLRKLIGFLVGRISLVKLQEMVRFIYVEAAEDKLKKESPAKSVALTKLALVTGLDTRTLTRTRNHETYRRPFHKKSAFLREFTPGAEILGTWASDSRFIDAKTGAPKVLELEGEEDSFESLFSSTIKSRGVTPQSLLERLIHNGSVRVDEDRRVVELIQRSYVSTSGEDKLGAFEMGYAAAANLMETIVHNFEADENPEKFFQRGVWTHRLPEKKRRELRVVLNSVLEAAEQESRQILLDYEEENVNSSQVTAGISLFYFEDNVD